MNPEVNSKATHNLELTWEYEATVYVNREVPQEDGSSKIVAVEEKELLHIPRLSTRYLLRFRREVMARYGNLISNIQPGGAVPNIAATGLEPEALGELLLDLIQPGLLDRLVPTSFEKLVEKIMEVEGDVLNPPTQSQTPEPSTNTTST